MPGNSAVLSTEDYESIPEDEWIASDMTMYDSPLAELERQHCYSADVSGTPLIPATASTVESEPASAARPESSHAQPDNPTSSSGVDSSGSGRDSVTGGGDRL